MGAQAVAVIPEDIQFGQIETGSHTAAWCIVEMCSPWMDGAQDAEEFNHIPDVAIRSADRELPDSIWAYRAWCLGRLATWEDGEGRLWDITNWHGLYERAFQEAREFVRTYTKSSALDGATFYQ